MSDFLELARDLLLRPRDPFSWLSNVVIDLQRLTAGLAGDITLSQSEVAGTPPGLPVAASNKATLKLEKPILHYQNGRLRGAATLSVPTSYPTYLSEPLKIDVEMLDSGISLSDTPLVLQSGGQVGGVSYGVDARARILPAANFRGTARFLSILSTDWRLKVHYDANRLSSALNKAIAQPGAGASWENVGSELRSPGFDLSAVVQASLPLLGKVPISKLSFSAPTTRSLDAPLLGAAFPFPYKYQVSGIVPTPPGTLFDIWAVGLGHSRAEFNDKSGSSFNVALLPTVSVDGKSLLERFPVYGYLEYTRIHRVSEGLDLGFRFTLSPSSLDVARLTGSSAQDQLTLGQFLQKTKDLEEQTRARTMINFEIIGRHDWLGGR